MTVPHYGRREGGALTAASPGDTLYFYFGSYNDSGDSEAMSGFAVSDIEVFKNGSATPRATDSGYSLISDTGQVGDRVGLHRFSISLFNTADDSTFYAAGSHYGVAVDSVSIDGKTVRFWVGSFEVGSSLTDTGVNQRLSQIQADVDTGLRTHISDVDTGLHAHVSDVDTGLHSFVTQMTTDTGLRSWINWSDTGVKDHINDIDTGLRGILQTTGVHVTSIVNDTGIAQTVWRESGSTYTDTGSLGYMVDNPPGASVDTGVVNQAVWQANASRTITSFDVDTGLRALIERNDTGTKARLANLDTGTGTISVTVDTGIVNQAVWQGNDSRTLTAFGFDTGVANTVWKESGSTYVDTGSMGYLLDNVSTSASVDTGQVNRAVWDGDASRTLTAFGFDTGIAQTVWRESGSTYTDTGSLGYMVDNPPGATVDTGVVNQAVWVGNASRTLTSLDVDTGLRALIERNDTGTKARLANLDTGSSQDTTAGGLDTGQVNQAVWTADASRTLTSFDVDSGLRAHIIAYTTDTGLRDFIDQVDTGLHGFIPQAVADTGLRALMDDYDTGTKGRLAAVQTKTDSLTFTVAGQVDSNIQYVNDVAITGTGDTGLGDTWRPA